MSGARTEEMMRTLRMLALVCALVVVPLAPAGAQQELRTFHDPRGWFSISLPADWTLASDPARSLGVGFVHGFERSDAGGWVRSSLAADGPNWVGSYAVPFIGMLALELPSYLPPRAFGEVVRNHLPTGWTQTRDGETRIAGRDAFYQYMTRGDLYAVIVGIPTPSAAYLVMAGTVNQPERVNADFASIAQILESLRPARRSWTALDRPRQARRGSPGATPPRLPLEFPWAIWASATP